MILNVKMSGKWMTITKFLYCMVSGFVAAISGTICLAKKKMVGTQNNNHLHLMQMNKYTTKVIVTFICPNSKVPKQTHIH